MIRAVKAEGEFSIESEMPVVGAGPGARHLALKASADYDVRANH